MALDVQSNNSLKVIYWILSLKNLALYLRPPISALRFNTVKWYCVCHCDFAAWPLEGSKISRYIEVNPLRPASKWWENNTI